jgi:hypothetical protein
VTAPSSMQLGETKDPKKLIPGEVGHVRANVTELDDENSRITGMHQSFGGISTPGWSGGLALAAYETKREAELKKWSAFEDLLEAASSALATYAGALSTAQSRAQDAIDKWEEGERATDAAVTAYNDAVKRYNAASAAPSSPFGQPQLRPGPPGPFHDPGQAMRDEAEQILEDARKALDEAGQQALEALGVLEGGKTEGSDDWFGASGEVHGPKFSWKFWEDTFGNEKPGDKKSPFELSLGSAEGEAHVYKAEGKWEDYYGDFHVNADGSVTILGADGSAEATINKDGVKINADGTLAIAHAEGELHGEYGIAEGGVKGEALLGATGEGHLEAGKTGVHAGGELFAGGKISGTVEGDVGGVGGEGTAEGWAGAGIEGDADIGFKDGKFTIGGHGGAALGLGGKVGGEVTLDFPKMWETGGDIVESLGDLL